VGCLVKKEIEKAEDGDEDIEIRVVDEDEIQRSDCKRVIPRQFAIGTTSRLYVLFRHCFRAL